MTANQILAALACAKVNFYLHVTGRARNGYHLLDSLVVFASINDSVEVAPAAQIRVHVTGEYRQQVSDNENIVTKAAETLRSHFKINSGAEITLQKNLPVGAGIGGGSADAAATLKLLLRLWKINASPKELENIALELGADVPACLQSSSLYMRGIGEIIDPAPKIAGVYILLVSTGKQLLTKDVFAKYKGNFSQPVNHPKTFSSHNSLIEFLMSTRNDLQDAAIELMPGIAVILGTLKHDPNCLIARMSGSGSTCFGLFSKRKHAEDAAMKLSGQNPTWWVRVATII